MVKNHLEIEKKAAITLVKLLFFGLLISCQTDYQVKEFKDVSAQGWMAEKPLLFKFSVQKDGNFPVNYLLRNTPGYPFFNLYLKTSLKDSTGKVLTSGTEELILFDQKSGKPLGNGMGDLFDQKIASKVLSKYKFSKAHNYSIEIQHRMRPDKLPGILGVGFEIAK